MQAVVIKFLINQAIKKSIWDVEIFKTFKKSFLLNAINKKYTRAINPKILNWNANNDIKERIKISFLFIVFVME